MYGFTSISLTTADTVFIDNVMRVCLDVTSDILAEDICIHGAAIYGVCVTAITQVRLRIGIRAKFRLQSPDHLTVCLLCRALAATR